MEDHQQDSLPQEPLTTAVEHDRIVVVEQNVHTNADHGIPNVYNTPHSSYLILAIDFQYR